MPTALTGLVSWQTPNVYTSGTAYNAADVNLVAEDVALVYAKPWINVVLTAGTLIPVAALSPANGSSPLFASAPSGGTTSGIMTSTYQNSPAGTASFSFTGTSGVITPPSAVPGRYRIRAQAVCSTSSAQFRLSVLAYNASNAIIAAFPGDWTKNVTTATGYHEVASVEAVVPFNVSAYFGTATYFTIGAMYAAGTTSVTIGPGDSSYGPGSSPPSYYTYCDAEFDSSYGSY